ncbi:MAG: alanyl-tRNA editing protein [Ruminococcaceae bacterium]|nr:alanyl-tRNA editing protein [Oscillospiraceae bacterium]
MNADREYYVNPYLTEAKTVVVDCKESGGLWCVQLARTIFYPTGGGQPCDFGTIDEAVVSDVYEKDDNIYHMCDRPLPIGKEVLCKIDWPRRFLFMQQHSGEHIISGLIHKRFGYENTGFHMGSDTVTVDFSGELTYEQMCEIESEANKIVCLDLPCHVTYPDEQQRMELPYRSKKELSGQVRLVDFENIDLCACCGLHVSSTGQIGLIKLLSITKFHGGSRIEMLCSDKAFAYMNAVYEQNRKISALLSAKPLATAVAAERMAGELKAVQYRCTCLENELFASIAAAHKDSGLVVLFQKGLSPDAVRRLCDAVLHTCGGLCAVFSEKEAGWSYAVGILQGDVRETVKQLNAELNGRGGGKPNFAQGSVSCSRTQIESFFTKL